MAVKKQKCAYEYDKLYKTSDYSIFQMNRFNRPLRNKKRLSASMKKYGFLPSFPLLCHIENGELVVDSGHHRLNEAIRLSLPVYFVVTSNEINLPTIETEPPNWTLSDFVVAYAKKGNQNYQKLLDFASKYGYSLRVAASMLSGETTTRLNKINAIKDGTFEFCITKHLAEVVGITEKCRDCSITFYCNSYFVEAVSACCLVESFDAKKFANSIAVNPAMMVNRGTRDGFLEEIEKLYNHRNRSRVALKHEAKRSLSERQRTFGRC